ncbi:MAG: ABC transporter permease, partial [Anaerolineae bacterium]|nr:ABC transporter permease [Anaerolineae bacterium]
AFDYVVGISLSQVLIGVVAVALTFATAVALDFESQGPIWVAIVIGAVTSLAMVGVGLLVACYSRTVSRAFMISTFPLFLMMFFSGAFFPVGDVPLFTVGGRTIQAFDLLPPTHAVVALNKVLTLGEGLGDILFELSAVLVLSLVYFVVGVWSFRRTQLSRQ